LEIGAIFRMFSMDSMSDLILRSVRGWIYHMARDFPGARLV
jgi:hypothetical protein